MPDLVNNLPTNRDENWRYANLRPLAKARVEAVPAGAATTDLLPEGAAALPLALAGHERWVFVDGRHEASLSKAAADSHAMLLDAAQAGEAFAAMLDSELVNAGVDFSLARANARRGDQVLHIELPAGGDAAAIELVFVASASASQGTSYPRVQVHAHRNSRLSLIERHLGSGDADSAVNAAVDIAIGAGASVDHVRVQDCSARASVFDTLMANVDENASYRLRTVTLGGLASRSTAFIKLAGRAARCEFVAASIANGIQSHDIFAEIDHAAPQATTREIFRGIANDRGKLAFNGKMIVRATAHDADSDQSLKSLLTGSGAEAAARPQLEIYTDRVRAKHGATTGKLDEQMLFYLLSRGIDRPTAQSLLQWAFIEDVVSRIEPLELRQDVERRASAQLLEVASLDLLGAAS
jgi:Fe-S cluster assembly protein SufD